MENLLHWLWLSLSCTEGGENFKKLYSRFLSAEAIYNADEDAIAAVIGSKNRDFKKLADKNLDTAKWILDFCRTKNVGILIYESEKYPNSLREIKNPPVLLYYRGKLPDFNLETFISVVGTRAVSEYGKKNAFYISRDLAKAGAVIVSGMAVGIDGVALSAAVSEGGKAVAIIGSGIDVCYPAQHKTLARGIVQSGCVMTEYPPKTKPLKHNFPTRNRIISALSLATVVIEGSEKSGALITARRAREQGKAVYALPGNVGNKTSEATNLLIKNGAKPITSADDLVNDFSETGKLNPFKMLEPSSRDMISVLKEYEVAALSPSDKVFFRSRRQESKEKATDAPKAEQKTVDGDKIRSLPRELRDIYDKIPENEAVAQDTLLSDKVTMRELMRALLRLEIKGLVTLLPGECVKRNS